MRRCLLWLVGLPVAVAAAQVSHRLAYLVVISDPKERARSLTESGHGYLDHLPVAASTALAALLVLLLTRSRTHRAQRQPRCWPFGLMPLLLFGLQEPIERLAVHHALPVSVFSEPTFLVGMALQVPAGVVVWALARLLLEAAAVVRRVLVESAVPRPAYRHARAAHPARIFLPTRSPLACSLAKRGPPRLLLL